MPYGMRPPEFPSLKDFLYEAVLLPEAAAPPPRAILSEEGLRVHIRDFGGRPGMCVRWRKAALRPPATSGSGLWSAACKGFSPAADTEYTTE